MNKREREGDCENVAFPFAICSLEFIAAACQDLRILAAPASTLQLQHRWQLQVQVQMTDDRQWGPPFGCCLLHVACTIYGGLLQSLLGSLCKLVKVRVEREIGGTNNGGLR